MDILANDGFSKFDILKEADNDQVVIVQLANNNACSYVESSGSTGSSEVDINVGETTSAASASVVTTCTVLLIKSTIV